ncbi:hypothetical protein E4U21_007024 [Claviceps maximensis]|nr:hypothetical protein E4U21_007024 [Claviceps maximensis]
MRPASPPAGLDRHVWMRMRDAFNDDPEARMHASVRDNDMPLLRRLVRPLEVGSPELNYCDPEFGSALQVAVLCDNMTAVGILLHAGTNPFVFHGSTEPQTSALDVAIQKGNHDIFTRICESLCLESDDEATERRRRHLFLRTALNGQASMVTDVLAWSTPHVMSDSTLEQALGNAVSGWHVEVVELLLSRFRFSPLAKDLSLCRAADFRADLLEHPRAEATGLDYVSQQQLISCLVDAGANPNTDVEKTNLVIETATWIDLVGALKALLEKGADPDQRGLEGETALHHLGLPVHINKGPQRRLHETGIRLLLKAGASVTTRDESGNTPIHYAAFGSNKYIFDLLTTNPRAGVGSLSDADLESIRNNTGETLLHWAAAGKKTDTIRHLVSARRSDINAVNANGWTPLMCALGPSVTNQTSMPRHFKALEAARILLEHGADPLTFTVEGWTPLHCLSLYLDESESESESESNGSSNSTYSNDLAEMAQVLVARGLPVDSRAIMLPTSHTTTFGRRKSLRVSNRDVGIWGSRVAKYLPPNSNESCQAATKPHGATLLHWAVFHGALGVAGVLLANGADPNALDEGHHLPADLIDNSPLLQRHPEIRARMARMLGDATSPCSSGTEHRQKRKRTTT